MIGNYINVDKGAIVPLFFYVNAYNNYTNQQIYKGIK